MFYEDKTIHRTSYSYRWTATCESVLERWARNQKIGGSNPIIVIFRTWVPGIFFSFSR